MCCIFVLYIEYKLIAANAKKEILFQYVYCKKKYYIRKTVSKHEILKQGVNGYSILS